MNVFYYLDSCNTCQRILNELKLPDHFELREIKSQAISISELEAMRNLSGSYESLFSKRARRYKELDLKNKVLTEEAYKSYILEHYTFLKRPVLITGSSIFIGNSKKVVAAAKTHLDHSE